MAAPDADFEKLVEAYFDGSLSSEERQRLETRLRDDPEIRRVYWEIASWQAAFNGWGEEHAGVTAARDFISTESASARPRRRIFSAVAWVGFAAALVLGVGALISKFRMRHEVLAELTFEQKAEWVGAAPTAGRELRPQSYRLKSGMIRFETHAGAVVTIAAPAEFDFVAADRIEMHRGKLTARMLREGSQLTVKIGEMEVRDLGTAFGIDANDAQRTLVSVFDGLVAVTSRATPGEELRLAEGSSFVAPRDASAGATQTRYEPEAFRDLWPLTVGIDEASKLVEFLPPGPLLKPLRDYRADDRLFLFPEQQNATLDYPLDVDLSGEVRAWPESPVSPYPIARGQRVDSYFVFFQPGPDPREPQHLTGDITFQRPVIGVICSDRALDQSDRVLGDKNADYLAPGQRRGLEATNGERYRGGRLPHDSLRLSADGRTLHFDFHVWGEREQIRVLVAAP